jgi:hypothetical protein
VDGFESAPIDPKADAKVDPRAEPKEKGKPVVLEVGKVEADGMTHVRRTLADGTQAYFIVPKDVTLLPKGENVELLATANSSRLKLLDLSLKFPNLAVRVRKQLPQQTRFFRTVPIKHR